MPVISVLMPIRKIDAFVEASLRSLEEQDFRDFELLAICPMDVATEVERVVASTAPTFPFRVIGAKLPGFAFALNLGLNQAQGEFIARWDADDLCDSVRLARQVQEFRANPDLAVVGTRVTLIDERGIPIVGHRFRFYGDDRAIRRALRYRQPIMHSAAMFRAETILRNKGYLYGGSSEDHELYLRLARNRALQFLNLPDVTTFYRRHSAQVTSAGNWYQQFCDIAGFMCTEFLRSGNPMYLIGAFASLPFARKARAGLRALVRIIR